MNLGPLNRRALLLYESVTVGVGGVNVVNLVPVMSLDLTVGEVGSEDALPVKRETDDATGVWTTRWFHRVGGRKYALTFDGITYRINSWRELGRRQGYVIKGEVQT